MSEATDVPLSMLRRTRSVGLALAITVVAALGFVPGAGATVITVGTTADEFNTGASCSLREAVEAANTNAIVSGCLAGQAGAFDPDAINIPAGTYSLTISGVGNNSIGDLDVTDTNLTIQNTGGGQTTINGAAAGDRVLEIAPTAFAVAITGIRFTGATSASAGGGISSAAAPLTLNQVTVDGKTPGGVGGGVFVTDPAHLAMTNTTISGNRANGNGGGVAFMTTSGSPSFIKNSTIVSNIADLDATGDGTGGGISESGTGITNISNTILSGNGVNLPFSGFRAEDCSGDVFSGGSNLVGTNANCTYPGASVTNGNITGSGTGGGTVIAHNTGALANNGGTVLTRLPARTSPALNRGYISGAGTFCEAVDARGAARPEEGRCDIGAVEATAPVAAQVFAATTTADEFETTFSGACSLREAVTSANTAQATGGCPAGGGSFVPSTVQLGPGTFNLTRAGVEDANVNGDLDLLLGPGGVEGTSIQGTGTTQTTIDGGDLDRVIQTHPASVGNSIVGVNIRNGTTTGNGGGILASGELFLTAVTVSGNFAGGNGGGVRWSNPLTAASINNSTVSGNQANGDGGGMFSDNVLFPTATNITVTQNTADVDLAGGHAGGGLSSSSSGFRLANSIVAGNTDASTGDAPDCFFSTSSPSQGHNLVGVAENCNLTAGTGDQFGTLAAPKPAGLGTLANNGGRTLTHAPVFGSLALNTGSPEVPGSSGTSCLLTDQIGTTRPLGGRCEIGAVETAPAAPSTQSGAGGGAAVTETGQRAAALKKCKKKKTAAAKKKCKKKARALPL